MTENLLSDLRQILVDNLYDSNTFQPGTKQFSQLDKFNKNTLEKIKNKFQEKTNIPLVNFVDKPIKDGKLTFKVKKTYLGFSRLTDVQFTPNEFKKLLLGTSEYQLPDDFFVELIGKGVASAKKILPEITQESKIIVEQINNKALETISRKIVTEKTNLTIDNMKPEDQAQTITKAITNQEIKLEEEKQTVKVNNAIDATEQLEKTTDEALQDPSISGNNKSRLQQLKQKLVQNKKTILLGISSGVLIGTIYNLYINQMNETAKIFKGVSEDLNGCILVDINKNTQSKIDILTCQKKLLVGSNVVKSCVPINEQCPSNMFNPCLVGSTLINKSKPNIPGNCNNFVAENSVKPCEGKSLVCSRYCDSRNFNLSPGQYLVCNQLNTLETILYYQTLHKLKKQSTTFVYSSISHTPKIVEWSMFSVLFLIFIILLIKYIKLKYI